MITDTQVVALDIETSGSDPAKHQMLSIGAIDFQTGETFYTQIRHKEILAVPEAMAVNQLDITEVNNKGYPNLLETDDKLKDFLRSLGPPRGYGGIGNPKTVPMGLNVGSFDMLFVRRDLPQSAEIFRYHAIDLNSLMFSFASSENSGFKSVRKGLDQYTERVLSENRAISKMGKHHALWDCYANCVMFSKLTGWIPDWMEQFESKQDEFI